MSEDWDVLIILDACRADTFAKYKHLLSVEGEYRRRVSPASSSMEFMETTFEGRNFHDTVYITANPHVEYLEDDIFHDVHSLLADEYWDSELDTVLPETVAQKGIEARQEYPDKRLILHFMQPHYPFVGEKGQQLSHRGYNKSMKKPTQNEPSIWQALREDPSAFDLEQVREAYEENLAVALETIDDLLDEFEGEKIAITADHGNFLGERLWPIPLQEFGHPGTAFAPETVYVPWLSVPGDDRPEINSDVPIKSENSQTQDVVTQRLDALGYRE